MKDNFKILVENNYPEKEMSKTMDIKFDDGLWECQVTASSFESQDALASKPARLVVRGKNENKMIFFLFYIT